MNSACVLIVDDDDQVRSMLLYAMQYAKIDALAASSGEEALALLAQNRERVQVAVVDVQMPTWDGPRTVAAMHSICPNLPCVFITGESGSYSMETLRCISGRPILCKPSQLPIIINTIRELMFPDSD